MNAHIHTNSSQLYDELAMELPNEVALGGAHISLVEPDKGMESAYNRWYEDDHFYAGAMAGPWKFSGKRFVATRALRSVRKPSHSPVAPNQEGCYLALYWLTAGHEHDAQRWALKTMNDALAPAGRALNPPGPDGVPGPMIGRSHTYTAWHFLVHAAVRDPSPMRIEFALDRPFAGVILELIEATNEVQLLDLWLTSHLNTYLSGTVAAVVGSFRAMPYPQELQPAIVRQPAALLRRRALLWFIDEDPRCCFPDVLEGHHQALAASRAGHLLLSAPFIPTIPGTNSYVDELR